MSTPRVAVTAVGPPPSQPPPGWYRAPDGIGEQWWDGTEWTGHHRAQQVAPPPAPRKSGKGKVVLAVVLTGVAAFAGCAGLVALAPDPESDSRPAQEPAQGSEPVDTESGDPARELEQTIRPELQKQTNQNLREMGYPPKARVRSVSCVQGTETEAQCFAVIVGPPGYSPRRERVSIAVTINPDSGSLLWRTED